MSITISRLAHDVVEASERIEKLNKELEELEKELKKHVEEE